MNTILLHPTDVLFFRDGRPMGGASSGHGAAWPLPNVTGAALHAALHRSGLSGHRHDQRCGDQRQKIDARQFGSLVTAGPFPVHKLTDRTDWYFPRPADLLGDNLTPALLPIEQGDASHSSLPAPLRYAIANQAAPNKENKAKAWLRVDAFERYLNGGASELGCNDARNDSDFSDAEATIGIAIDPATGTAGQGDAEGKIYSAHYLRLHKDWHIGVFAATAEKDENGERQDLIRELFMQDRRILVGGQQRLCTASLVSNNNLPLPRGRMDGFAQHKGKYLIKWVLLSPAIWPEIPPQSKDGRAMNPHPGGWLPNWVGATDGQVLLRVGKRQRRTYNGKHSRSYGSDSSSIAAKLVAAVIPKPIVITGWALANNLDRAQGGAKSSHLAVAAGAVYYFEADTESDAQKLAVALNWHGDQEAPTIIQNRRSTLVGEKGFGLGVCGTWQPHRGGRHPA